MHTFGCITAHNEKDLLLPSSSTSDNYNEKAHVTEVQSLEIEVGFGWNTQISAGDRGGKKFLITRRTRSKIKTTSSAIKGGMVCFDFSMWGCMVTWSFALLENVDISVMALTRYLH